jgi:AraC-like DNA-binding protein
MNYKLKHNSSKDESFNLDYWVRRAADSIIKKPSKPRKKEWLDPELYWRHQDEIERMNGDAWKKLMEYPSVRNFIKNGHMTREELLGRFKERANEKFYDDPHSFIINDNLEYHEELDKETLIMTSIESIMEELGLDRPEYFYLPHDIKREYPEEDEI